MNRKISMLLITVMVLTVLTGCRDGGITGIGGKEYNGSTDLMKNVSVNMELTDEEMQDALSKDGNRKYCDFSMALFKAAMGDSFIQVCTSEDPGENESGSALEEPEEGNLLVSPLSVIYAMAMTANGAGGMTRCQLLMALTEGEFTGEAKCGTSSTGVGDIYDEYQDNLNDYLRAYMNLVNKNAEIDAQNIRDWYGSEGKGMQPPVLSIANSIWINQRHRILEDYRKKMEAAGGVGNLTVYAVDSKVVVKRTEQFATTNPDFSEIVDINAKHLKALMSTIEDPSVDIVLSQGNLFLRTGSVVIDAKYTACENTVPDAERVLSTKNSRYSVSFDKADMLGKLRMSSTFTGNDRTARAVLTFLKDETRLEAVSETTRFADMQVLSEISDENACGLTATFSLSLLQDILRIYPDDTIKLDFTSSTQPFWLCAEDGDENEKSILTACFMPLKS